MIIQFVNLFSLMGSHIDFIILFTWQSSLIEFWVNGIIGLSENVSVVNTDYIRIKQSFLALNYSQPFQEPLQHVLVI